MTPSNVAVFCKDSQGKEPKARSLTSLVTFGHHSCPFAAYNFEHASELLTASPKIEFAYHISWLTFGPSPWPLKMILFGI